MKPYVPLVLSGFLLGLPWSSLRAADDAEDKAVAFVKTLGGKVERDDKAEGKPVRGVDLSNRTMVTDAGLKELAALKQLQSLNLRDCNQVTDAGLKELGALQQLSCSICAAATR